MESESFQAIRTNESAISSDTVVSGMPTDNAAMEAINGWIKAELFMDLHVTGDGNVETEIADYITFFNEQRPAYALNYLTPRQYWEQFAPAHDC